VVASKGGGGIQRFRYETEFGKLDTDEAMRVNPLDNRGDSGSGKLEKRKSSLQRLSSDIAPFYKLPNLVVSLREDFYSSQFVVKPSYGGTIDYIP